MKRRRQAARPAPSDARHVALRVLTGWIEDPESRVLAALETAGVALDGRDAGLARELVLGTVRRQRLLDHVLSGLVDRGLPQRPDLLAALRIGAYQLLDLDRVPPHAAVAATVGCLPPRRRPFVNAVLRRLARAVVARDTVDTADPQVIVLGDGRRALRCAAPLPAAHIDPLARAALEGGVPDWLARRWGEQFGVDAAVELCAGACAHPGTHLRAVPGSSRAALLEELRAAGLQVEPHPEQPRMLSWQGGTPGPFDTAAWREGRFVVQDPTAVRAAEAVGAQPGERILDLCAAPGTKATLLGEAVGPGGSVVAHDIDPDRLGRVSENATRLRMPWIEATGRLATQAPPFDRVLVDVPCSNTGVLARRVELRHLLTPARITELAVRQRALLAQAVALVRSGGTIVYATCSIEHEENAGVVDAVVASCPGLECVAAHMTLPAPPTHDGGYHAVLISTG